MKKLDNIKYTINHKKAFLTVEKELLGKNTLRGYLHDIDKLFMYIFLSKKKASKLHRKLSRHHNNAKSDSDYIQMIIDWECARITKPDKILNARETLWKYYPNLRFYVLPLLDKLGL